MIFFKVYSKRSIFKAILIFLILLLSIIILFTRSWEETAVFHALREEVILILSPSDPSKIYINGEEIEQGNVDEKNPCIYKTKADRSIDIKIEPVGDEMPVETTLTFKNGRLSMEEDQEFWNDLTIFEWPNQVYEILVDLYIPTKVEKPKGEKIIEEERTDLDQDNHLERLQFIKQGDFYFMKIDRSSKVLLKDYQERKFTPKIQDMNQDGKKEIVVQGDFGQSHQYIEIFQFDQEQIKRIFWEHGDDIEIFSDGRISVGKRLYDTVDHYSKIFYQWKDGEYKKEDGTINWWQGNAKWPSTPQNTVKAFFEAYQLDLLEEAKGYLTKGQQTDQGLETMISKVQKEWISISSPCYYFLGGYGEGKNIYMAFYYDTKAHSKYKKVKIYEIEFENRKNSEQGPWKIKNIREVTDYVLVP